MKNTFSSQDFILTAVRANGDVLRYASGWHCDPEVVLTAIEKVQHQPTTWGCRAGGAVCSWVHVDENLWRLPMLFTMWIPDSGSVWSNLDERICLYHRVTLNVQRDLCGIIKSEIHHPFMQWIL